MTHGKLLPFRRGVTTGSDGGDARLSDEALVAACALDGDALGALFDRFHADVHRFLSRFARLDDDARDDIVQLTFLQVQRAAPRFRGTSAVKTWILGVAVNVARNEVRSLSRRGAMADGAGELAAPAIGPRPDELLERRQLNDRLARAIEELSPKLRSVFLMCDVEGIPGVEVARALELREGTLWRRLHDARKQLRAALDGEGTR